MANEKNNSNPAVVDDSAVKSTVQGILVRLQSIDVAQKEAAVRQTTLGDATLRLSADLAVLLAKINSLEARLQVLEDSDAKQSRLLATKETETQHVTNLSSAVDSIRSQLDGLSNAIECGKKTADFYDKGTIYGKL